MYVLYAHTHGENNIKEGHTHAVRIVQTVVCKCISPCEVRVYVQMLYVAKRGVNVYRLYHYISIEFAYRNRKHSHHMYMYNTYKNAAPEHFSTADHLHKYMHTTSLRISKLLLTNLLACLFF